jgi:hypothetical protein
MSFPANRVPRLPVRIEPLHGESWLGYTGRAAAFYRTSWSELMSRVVPGGQHACRYPLTPRFSGIAATPQTLTVFGRFLNLSPAEVSAMHLMAYDGSALTFDRDPYAQFDPLMPAPSRGTLTARRLGRLVHVREPRFCPDCLRSRPEFRPLSWRLSWHLICLEHRRLLELGASDDSAIDDAVLDGQQMILDRLQTRLDNRRFFDDMENWLQAQPPSSTSQLVYPRSAQDLAGTVAAVTNPGFPCHQGLDAIAIQRRRRDATRLLRSAPLPIARRAALELWHVPHLMPRRMFVPDLADLCFPTHLRDGRAAAAIAAYMAATGAAADEAEHLTAPRGGRTAGALFDITIRLEREGRLEHFWNAIAHAAAKLADEQVDYPARRAALQDDATYRTALTADPRAHRWILKVWLVDQWACTFTDRQQRPSARSGRIEEFDIRHGPALTAGIREVLQVA